MFRVSASVAAGLLAVASLSQLAAQAPTAPVRFPAHQATGVNPDTHLVLTFSVPPVIGNSGQIRIYDVNDNALVDTLDLAIPAGPTRGVGPAAVPPPPYQLTVIGGFKEGFHFYPIIVRGNTATIYLHNNVLERGKAYYVQIDPGVIVANGFSGFRGRSAWRFSTNRQRGFQPGNRIVVAGDGSGLFNTVQGAVDSVPDHSPTRTTIFIKSGNYEEIVYFRNKSNITFLGEDRDKVIIGYANNETFNGPPTGVPTNEKPTTFPYRRASFMADDSRDIHIVNLSLRNLTPRGGGQAEALLLKGGRNIVSQVNLFGHQDTLQFNDSVFLTDSYIEGDTDFMWGRGPAFFQNCTIKELQATSPFMWVRSTAASHGFVFKNCSFEATPGDGPGPFLARNTAAYPNSEVVLINCALGLINPAAWSLAGDTSNQHYWEFNSTNLGSGTPADVSQRHPASRQLTMAEDSDIIANYSNPAYVLGGWVPSVVR